jgi:hypothetical protein
MLNRLDRYRRDLTAHPRTVTGGEFVDVLGLDGLE